MTAACSPLYIGYRDQSENEMRCRSRILAVTKCTTGVTRKEPAAAAAERTIDEALARW
jgi:hypothetical protein